MEEDYNLKTMITQHIVHVYELNQRKAIPTAKKLGCSRSTVYRYLQKVKDAARRDTIGVYSGA